MPTTISEEDQIAMADGEWKPIPRISRTVPFGYKINPEDGSELLPVIEELEALDRAKKFVGRYSYRVLATWLTELTGRFISHEGLRKRLLIERARRNKITALKKWADKYREAEEKVRKYEEERIRA